jgi:hypothetical protein
LRCRCHKQGQIEAHWLMSNGRWKDVLTDADLALYETAVQCELTPACRAWLENGERWGGWRVRLGKAVCLQ